MAGPTYIQFARRSLQDAEAELERRFGRDALEESGFPIYTNRFPPAAYLGWNRISHGQQLLRDRPHGGKALDFGSGLGVTLPFLSQSFDRVVAFDLNPGPTSFMVERMGLHNVDVRDGLADDDVDFDVIVALDVLEHVHDLEGTIKDLLHRSADGAVWIISGPTENWFYHLMRRLSRTRGEGHERTIYDVFAAFPSQLKLRRTVRLPFGLPVPLFLISYFDLVLA